MIKKKNLCVQFNRFLCRLLFYIKGDGRAGERREGGGNNLEYKLLYERSLFNSIKSHVTRLRQHIENKEF